MHNATESATFSQIPIWQFRLPQLLYPRIPVKIGNNMETPDKYHPIKFKRAIAYDCTVGFYGNSGALVAFTF